MIDEFREALKKAESDKKIAAPNHPDSTSPGGTVTASDILNHEILRLQRKKPVTGWSPV